MALQVALLRGINVGGHSAIGMTALQKLFVDLGHTDVATYVQSGNVVFTAKSGTTTQIAAKIEEQIAKTFGFNVSVLLRTPTDLNEVLTSNPYLDIQDDPTKLYVTFLEKTPALNKVSSLEIPKGEAAVFTVAGREVFLHCLDGYGRTKLNNNFFERKLGMRATTRNWKTINVLQAMVSETS
jgi:uncharacterized protein (DUF1697 family)